MSTRRERADRRAALMCPNCGQPGPHLVPPGFGDPGMFICASKPEQPEQPEQTQQTQQVHP